jgi:hypothetical protein
VMPAGTRILRALHDPDMATLTTRLLIGRYDLPTPISSSGFVNDAFGPALTILSLPRTGAARRHCPSAQSVTLIKTNKGRRAGTPF